MPDGAVSTRASFLGLPPELRVRIYELVVDTFKVKGQGLREGSFMLHLHGSNLGAQKHPINELLALLRICHAVCKEIAPLIPSVREMTFQFVDFTREGFQAWLSAMGDERIAQIRNWEMAGWAECISPVYRDGHYFQDRLNEDPPCSWHSTSVCNRDCEVEADPEARMGLCRVSIEVRLGAYEGAVAKARVNLSGNNNDDGFNDCAEALMRNEYVKGSWCQHFDESYEMYSVYLEEAVRGLVTEKGTVLVTKARLLEILDVLYMS